MDFDYEQYIDILKKEEYKKLRSKIFFRTFDVTINAIISSIFYFGAMPFANYWDLHVQIYNPLIFNMFFLLGMLKVTVPFWNVMRGYIAYSHAKQLALLIYMQKYNIYLTEVEGVVVQ